MLLRQFTSPFALYPFKEIFDNSYTKKMKPSVLHHGRCDHPAAGSSSSTDEMSVDEREDKNIQTTLPSSPQQQQFNNNIRIGMERGRDEEVSDRNSQSYQPTSMNNYQLTDQQQIIMSSSSTTSTNNVLFTNNPSGSFYNNIIRRENRLKMHKRKATSGVPFQDWDPDVREKKVKKFVQACSDGNFVQMYKLFREGVDINTKDRYDESGLYNAANEGHYTILKFLVKHGANIDAANSGVSVTSSVIS